ncbi:MAG: glycosyltransferase WbuB [Sphingomonadales bacterium]|nr:MAG: glycosyltransferase WbuB [Sphingomonadales bacterium]
MRILVSDYSGHPFQVQLSRSLALRGHTVLHVASASFQTPKGRLDATDQDSPNFSTVNLKNKRPFAKSGLVRRYFQEIEMGKLIGKQIADFRPDIVISSNAPLDTQRIIQLATRKTGAKFVFWIQDVYSEAIHSILSRRLGLVGAFVGAHYRRLEARLLRRAHHVVAIAPEFVPLITALAGIEPDKVTVIPNWAPLGEIGTFERDNEWVRENLPDTRFRAVYSGTLGFKHDPDLLYLLATQIDGDVVVFSEGEAADQLKQRAKENGVTNLLVRGWLPFEELPKALAGADVLIVVLEPDAGAFSVPSKVLTYLCVGRPILGSILPQNLAAQIITEAEAGETFAPGDRKSFIAAATSLAENPARIAQMGTNARAYAETAFDIEKITERFEQVITIL